jgi:hypothetical protein
MSGTYASADMAEEGARCQPVAEPEDTFNKTTFG